MNINPDQYIPSDLYSLFVPGRETKSSSWSTLELFLLSTTTGDPPVDTGFPSLPTFTDISQINNLLDLQTNLSTLESYSSFVVSAIAMIETSTTEFQNLSTQTSLVISTVQSEYNTELINYTSTNNEYIILTTTTIPGILESLGPNVSTLSEYSTQYEKAREDLTLYSTQYESTLSTITYMESNPSLFYTTDITDLASYSTISSFTQSTLSNVYKLSTIEQSAYQNWQISTASYQSILSAITLNNDNLNSYYSTMTSYTDQSTLLNRGIFFSTQMSTNMVTELLYGYTISSIKVGNTIEYNTLEQMKTNNSLDLKNAYELNSTQLIQYKNSASTLSNTLYSNIISLYTSDIKYWTDQKSTFLNQSVSSFNAASTFAFISTSTFNAYTMYNSSYVAYSSIVSTLEYTLSVENSIKAVYEQSSLIASQNMSSILENITQNIYDYSNITTDPYKLTSVSYMSSILSTLEFQYVSTSQQSTFFGTFDTDPNTIQNKINVSTMYRNHTEDMKLYINSVRDASGALCDVMIQNANYMIDSYIIRDCDIQLNQIANFTTVESSNYIENQQKRAIYSKMQSYYTNILNAWQLESTSIQNWALTSNAVVSLEDTYGFNYFNSGQSNNFLYNSTIQPPPDYNNLLTLNSQSEQDIKTKQMNRLSNTYLIPNYFSKIINANHREQDTPSMGSYPWNSPLNSIIPFNGYSSNSPCIAWFDATTIASYTNRSSQPIVKWAPVLSDMKCTFHGSATLIPVGANGLPVVRVLRNQTMRMKVNGNNIQAKNNLTILAVSRLLYNTTYPTGSLAVIDTNNPPMGASLKWKPGNVFTTGLTADTGFGYTLTSTGVLHKNSVNFGKYESINKSRISGQSATNKWDMYCLTLNDSSMANLYEGGFLLNNNPIDGNIMLNDTTSTGTFITTNCKEVMPIDPPSGARVFAPAPPSGPEPAPAAPSGPEPAAPSGPEPTLPSAPAPAPPSGLALPSGLAVPSGVEQITPMTPDDASLKSNQVAWYDASILLGGSVPVNTSIPSRFTFTMPSGSATITQNANPLTITGSAITLANSLTPLNTKVMSFTNTTVAKMDMTTKKINTWTLMYLVRLTNSSTSGRIMQSSSLENVYGFWNGAQQKLNMNNVWLTTPALSTTPASDTNWHIVTITASGATVKMFWDGNPITLIDTSTVPTTSGLVIFPFDGFSINGKDSSACEVAEIIVYNTAIVDSTRKSIEQYLKDKWINPLPPMSPDDSSLTASQFAWYDASVLSGLYGTTSGATVSSVPSKFKNMTPSVFTGVTGPQTTNPLTISGKMPLVVKSSTQPMNLPSGLTKTLTFNVMSFSNNTVAKMNTLTTAITSWTLMFLVRRINTTDSGGILQSVHTNISYYGYITTLQKFFSINSGSSISGTQEAADTKWHYVTITSNGTAMRIFWDGVEMNSSNPSNYAFHGIGINNTTGNSVNCEVAEIITYTTVVSDIQRKRLERYLLNKWQIPLVSGASMSGGGEMKLYSEMRGGNVTPIQPNDASLTSSQVVWYDASTITGISVGINGEISSRFTGVTNPLKVSGSVAISLARSSAQLNSKPLVYNVMSFTKSSIAMMNTRIPSTNTWTMVFLMRCTGGAATGFIQSMPNDPLSIFGYYDGPKMLYVNTKYILVASAPDTNWHYATIISTGSNITMFWDGVSVVSSNDVNGYSGFTGISINSSGYNINGELAEIFIYKTAITDAQRRGLEAYLVSKWTGIQSTTSDPVITPDPVVTTNAPSDISIVPAANQLVWYDASSIQDNSVVVNGTISSKFASTNPLRITGAALSIAQTTATLNSKKLTSKVMSFTTSNIGTLSSALTPTTTWTMMYLVKINSQFFISGHNDQYGLTLLPYYSGSTINFYINGTPYNINTSVKTADTNWHYITIISTGSKINIYWDGTPVIINVNLNTYSFNGFGFNNAPSHSHYKGNAELAEVFAYNIAINEQQRLKLEQYLVDKWTGVVPITGNVPTPIQPTDASLTTSQLAWYDASVLALSATGAANITSVASSFPNTTANPARALTIDVVGDTRLPLSVIKSSQPLKKNVMSFSKTTTKTTVAKMDTITTPLTSWTLMFLVRQTAINQGRILQSASSANGSDVVYGFWSNQNNGKQQILYFLDRWITSSWETVASSPAADTNWHYVSIIANGATLNMYWDGLLVTNTSTRTSYPFDGIAINRREPSACEVAEIIIYKTAITDTQRQGIEAYLVDKWIIPIAPDNILNANQIAWYDAAKVTDASTVISSQFANTTNLTITGDPLKKTSNNTMLFSKNTTGIMTAISPEITSWTLVFLVRKVSNKTRGTLLQSVNTIFNGLGKAASYGYWNDQQSILWFDKNIDPTTNFLTTTSKTTDTSWHYATITCSAAPSSSTSPTIKMYWDGVLVPVTVPTTGFPSFPFDGISINNTSVAADKSDAEVAEIIIYNRDINDVQRTGLEKYLVNKWITLFQIKPDDPSLTSSQVAWYDASMLSLGTTIPLNGVIQSRFSYTTTSGSKVTVENANNLTVSAPGTTAVSIVATTGKLNTKDLVRNVMSFPKTTSVSMAAITSPLTNWTLMFLVRQVTATSQGRILQSVSKTAPSIYGFLNNKQKVLYKHPDNFTSSTTSGTIDTEWHYVTITTTGSTVKMFWDGNPVPVSVTGGIQTRFPFDGIAINNDTGAELSTCEVAEIIIYKTAITDMQRMGLESYLVKKWTEVEVQPSGPGQGQVQVPSGLGPLPSGVAPPSGYIIQPLSPDALPSGTTVQAWFDASQITGTIGTSITTRGTTFQIGGSPKLYSTSPSCTPVLHLANTDSLQSLFVNQSNTIVWLESFTMIYYVRQTGGQNGYIFRGNGTQNGTDYAKGVLGFGSGKQQQLYMNYNSTDAASWLSKPNIASDTDWHIVTITCGQRSACGRPATGEQWWQKCKDQQVTMYWDGVQVATTKTTGHGFELDGITVNTGNVPVVPDSGYQSNSDCQIAECIVLNGVPSVPEFKGIELYLKNKWGDPAKGICNKMLIQQIAINPCLPVPEGTPVVTDDSITYYSSDCEIAEVFVFNRPLTNLERQSLEGYLGWKWGVDEHFPLNHPYRNAYP
jgi:hypothetical protein